LQAAHFSRMRMFRHQNSQQLGNIRHAPFDVELT
jgi:hypothetical protein